LDNKKDLALNYVTNRVPIIQDSFTVSDIFNFINKKISNFDTIDYIYILDKSKNLVGVLSIREIFKFSKKVKVKEIMQRNIVHASPETEKAKIADLALKHGIKSVPIVKNNKLLGVILTNKILSIINRALHERILYSAGVHKSHLEYEDTLHVPLLITLLHRTPWFIFGLLGVMFAAGFISKFENILGDHLILAFFIPAIVYMSDALGTQHQTLFIRDLAVFGKDLNMWRYILKQILIGFIIGLFIGILVFLIVSFFWKESYIALVISLAMFFTLVLSSITSLIITYLFKIFGQDPALGSGPFATIISDVSSIIIYFIVVALMID
jgi:magnesium transporter